VQNAKVHGNLPFLINQIKPAVARAKSWSPMASGDDLLNKSIKSNVWLTMENLLRKSHELKEKVKKGQLLVIGGIYDLNAGTINWLGQHPDQAKLLVEHAPVHAKPKAKAAEGEPTADTGGAMVPEANVHGEAKKAPAHP
jgi:carbonic anhydrase